MNLKELAVVAIAQKEMEKWGLPALGWRFAFDNAKRRLGMCDYKTKTISLSRHMVRLNFDTNLDEIIDTIRHEIAHALAGFKAGHGSDWKGYAVLVGAKPRRCGGEDIEMPKGNVRAVCGCGKTHTRMRMPRRGYTYSCRTCKYILNYRRVNA